MKLSEKLKSFRVDRPSEWMMDEFARDAERLEAALILIKDRFEDKQSLHKDDCFAYQIVTEALTNK